MIGLLPILKLIVLVFMLFYVGFAFLVLRQIDLMTEVLGTSLSPTLKALAKFHLTFAVVMAVISLLAL